MSEKQDIVERLHELKTTDAFAQVRLNKGIEEIKRLRSELAKVTAERDEAHRRICETTDMTNPSDDCYVRLTPQQIAEHYGWDCYKDYK